MTPRRSLAWAAFTALTTLSAWVEAHPDVKAFIQTHTSHDRFLDIITSESFCNFSLVNFRGRTQYMTAQHCIDPSIGNSDQKDIVLLDTLPHGSRNEDITDARIHPISPYTGREISGKTLTIKGFLPMSRNHSFRKMYTIQGQSRYNPHTRKVDMMITKAAFEKILQSVWRECRMGNYYLSGMSGSPVFDDQGRAFWVLSTNEAICVKDKKRPIIWVNDEYST